jgi:ubiquinone/menaquinone biosynthesis C-methylase UbiE
MSSEIDSSFENANRRYLSGFRAAIGPVDEATVQRLVRTYVVQEQVYSEKVRFVLHHLVRRPGKALDVGSSAGGFSAALAMSGIRVIGVEPSTAGVEVSRQRAERLGLRNASFEVGVGEQLPYSAESFDLVVSLAVLEHVQDVDAVLGEAFRVLRPGGQAYFEVPNNFYPFEGHYKLPWLPMMPKRLAKLYVAALGYRPEFLDELHYMNRPLAFRYFRKAGFSDVRDLYGAFIAGKVSGAAWTSGPGRLPGWAAAGWLARSLFGSTPSALLLNRAVFVLATKPEHRTGKDAA